MSSLDGLTTRLGFKGLDSLAWTWILMDLVSPIGLLGLLVGLGVPFSASA
jgi:hypothetical protein